MEVKLQDSLDVMHLTKNRLKQDKIRQQLMQIKQKFIQSLQKLQSSETRQIALVEIRKLIDKNRQPQHLRIYISILKALKPNSNSTTKQHQILVVSILAEICKQNLLDPVDKPPSLIKTSFRLVQIIHSYFADTTSTVQYACAKALLDIINYVLVRQSSQNILSLIFSPLASILKTGVDKASQATASVCINQLIQFWKTNHNDQCLRGVSKELLAISLKISTEYNQFFIALHSIVQIEGLSFFENKLQQFLAKILGILNNNKQSNFNNYMCKVYVCKIIEVIGILTQSSIKNKLNDLDIINCLDKASRNRIIQVQFAAHRALKAWKGQIITQTNQRQFTSLDQVRNNRKKQRSNSKDNIKLQEHLNDMKQDLEQMIKGGWGANNRAKKFVKRGTGIGGGFYGKVEKSPPNKNIKSHKQHIQQLRQFIQKQSQQNKSKDKFTFYQQKQEKSNKEVQQKNKKKVVIQQRKRSEGQQFVLDDDEGQQMIPVNNRQKYNNINQKQTRDQKNDKYSSIYDHVDKKQIQQLLDHQDSLIKAGQGMKQGSINLQLQSKDTKQPKIQKNKQQKLQKYYQQLINPIIQDKNKLLNQITFQKPEISKKNKKGQALFSKQQLQEIMIENSLSSVSENLNQLIQQKDLQINKSDFNQLDSKLISLEDQHLLIRQKKNQKSIAKSRASMMKFMRKPYDNDQPIIATGPNLSMNFSSSKKSKVNSPKKKQQEFKYNLNYINNKQKLFPEQKIKINKQQENNQSNLVESYFQSSIQKDRNFKKVIKQVNNMQIIPTKVHNQEQQGKVFQNMIKNPPKGATNINFYDKKSQIKETNKISQSNESQDKQSYPITQQWIEVLSFVEKGQINQAFSKTFQMDDPIYLLRLMLITQTPLRKLTAQNTTILWAKLIEIYKNQFIDVLFVQLFNNANELGMIKSSLTVEQLDSVLLKLYEVSGTSKGKLSFNAASLYNNISESIKSKQL